MSFVAVVVIMRRGYFSTVPDDGSSDRKPIFCHAKFLSNHRTHFKMTCQKSKTNEPH
jgi:hypothetical protein